MVSIAVMIATSGAGAALAPSLGLAAKGISAAMLSAGISTAASHCAISMLSNGGDPFKTLETMITADFLKTLAVSLGSAGLCPNVAAANETLIKQATTHLLRNAITGALKMGIQGQRLDETLKEVLTSTVVQTVGQHFANKIGKMYNPGKDKIPEINSATHKILHGALGAVTASIKASFSGGDPAQAALAGALGAMTTEVMVEALSSNIEGMVKDIRSTEEGRKLTKEQFNNLVTQKLEANADIARLSAGFVALLSGQDVDTALNAANNALDNNFLVAIPFIISAYGTLYTIYDVYDTYQKEEKMAIVRQENLIKMEMK